MAARAEIHARGIIIDKSVSRVYSKDARARWRKDVSPISRPEQSKPSHASTARKSEGASIVFRLMTTRARVYVCVCVCVYACVKSKFAPARFPYASLSISDSHGGYLCFCSSVCLSFSFSLSLSLSLSLLLSVFLALCFWSSLIIRDDRR